MSLCKLNIFINGDAHGASLQYKYKYIKKVSLTGAFNFAIKSPALSKEEKTGKEGECGHYLTDSTTALKAEGS